MRAIALVSIVVTSFFVIPACTNTDRPRMLFSCSDPAPLNGPADPAARGFIVSYHDGADAQAETDRLAVKCGFQFDHVFLVSPGFSAQLDPAQLDCVRCDSAVAMVSYDHQIFPS